MRSMMVVALLGLILLVTPVATLAERPAVPVTTPTPRVADELCLWKVKWKQHKLGEVREFDLSRTKGVRFGLEGDFLCTVAPVAPLAGVKVGVVTLQTDLNCKYPETERGVATGLATPEEFGAADQAYLFLLDQFGEIAHSVYLSVQCGSEVVPR